MLFTNLVAKCKIKKTFLVYMIPPLIQLNKKEQPKKNHSPNQYFCTLHPIEILGLEKYSSIQTQYSFESFMQ